jgi:hypothetical protein
VSRCGNIYKVATFEMKQMLKVYNLQTINEHWLSHFFNECDDLGYKNNISLVSIRAEFVKQRLGNIWFLTKDEIIIGMAGCHRFDEVDNTSFRIQFRGCELPGTDVKPGLSKSHFNSSTFRELIPYQLQWIHNMGYDKHNVYLTANTDNKNHRAMTLIERQGFLTKFKDDILFNAEQTIWKFNTYYYEQVRKRVTSYVV